MPRRKLIAANWKMNKSVSEATAFVAQMRPALASVSACDLVLFPPFFAVGPVAAALAGTPVGVGAQDVYWEASGAYTGEVSVAMLKDAGASWVIVGHSERRHALGESDEVVARKFSAAIAGGLTPILCVGETLAEREDGREDRVVEVQLEAAFAGKGPREASDVAIAYEPVWAIGTGRTATPDDAERMHRHIRAWLRNRFEAETAGKVRIQYGGSVKPDGARSLLERGEIDGLLVGGASLDAGSFLAIARAAV